MARLIHLNGPSRVGKSTLARRFADEHPPTLVLDLDVLVGLVGGWRQDFGAALEVARSLGRQLAAQHLCAGHDVIVPQLVTVYDQGPDPAYEQTARDAHATYLQVVLMVDDAEHLQRVRGKRPATEVEALIQTMLEDPERDLVGVIRGHLGEYLRTRPHGVRVDTTGLTENEAYQRVVKAVDAGTHSFFSPGFTVA